MAGGDGLIVRGRTPMATRSRTGRALGGIKPSGALAGVVPFFVYTTVFLIIPTLVVVIGAFLTPQGRPTMSNVSALNQPVFLGALKKSVLLSLATALIGAVVGGLLAYAISTSKPNGLLKRFVTSLSGVLAQFGGVALAFAFIASFGMTGLLTGWLAKLGVDLTGSLWLYEWSKGLMLVYLYFQIPLMVIVFLPAVEGLRPQWREATESLGGTTWTYWRKVALPILAPSFVGATLLLFTNAFSAYATVAALITQASPLVPQQVASTMSSDVIVGQENVGKAMAMAMVVVVAIVMAIYAWIDKRASRWLQR
ncbi:putative spermidine/putrescine transport system permease protein [Calidifontibacter indicus]|uniref:Putative spermidine/putrescine transport system permease protein n=2 Tax=Calidifontibacter indicus TaxID=419650 RepID=A0A3D9UL15_9MICO|nr:putative spermidine/putrescine transport system permease protein [Calidifontibacter indicus]